MDELVVAIVRTSFGVNGAVKIESVSGEVEHLLNLKQVRLRKTQRGSVAQRARDRRSKQEQPEHTFRVAETRRHGDLVVIALDGIDTPEDARAWQGAEVVVARSEAASKGPDEHYIADLIGCRLMSDGKQVAIVQSVWESGAADMLEVKTEQRVAHVPFISQFIGEVNTEARTIELLAPWVLE